MTVYVDDMRLRARVGRVNALWSHLTADTEEELHAFAADLGLKRSWFQKPKGIDGKSPAKPGSLKAQMWHYDVTDAKRDQAIAMGAVPITLHQSVEIIRARHARLSPIEEEQPTLDLDL